jgi:hypothetical protein
MRKLLCFVAHLLLVVCAPAACAIAGPDGFLIYRVGGGADCPYHTIQDAVDAATQHPGVDLVWIAMDQSYTDQHVVVTDQDVDIQGGFTDCEDIDPGSDVTIVNGTSGHSVFEIEGNSHVYMTNLQITGANMDESHSGGGIYFGGFGALELSNTVVNNNHAGYGGGIDMSPSGGHADLRLDAGTLIIENTALESGGGIRIEGDTRLYVLAPQTHIKLNHALNGYGGGIEVLTPAHADIGSPGYNGTAVVQFNDAVNGGGIALVGTGSADADTYDSVQIFTTDPLNPVQISDNRASLAGGGLYVATAGAGNQVKACVYDFRIHDNVASDGAAIYATGGDNYGAQIELNRPALFGENCGPDLPPALGAVPCAEGIPCNEVVGNISEDGSGVATTGSAIRGDAAALVVADRLIMRNNRGGHAIEIEGNPDWDAASALLELSNCLLAANSEENELISVHDGGSASYLHVDNCTIADNSSNVTNVIYSNLNFVEIISSIFDQLGQQVIDFSGAQGDLTAQYVLATNVSTLAGGVGLVDGEADFVDRANGDYHLQRTSFGVDFAPNATGSDLDRHLRTVDLIDIGNAFGATDLGAYEIQEQVVTCATSDTIYCNGFEGL